LAPQPYLRASRNGRRNVSSKRLRLISPGYGHSSLPWLEPVAISAGQEIQVELLADPVGGDYIWRWETKIYEEAKGVVHHFQQSTLQGTLFSPQWLRRHALDFVPVLSEAGEAERWPLEAMDGNAPLHEIASAAADVFRKFFDGRKRRFGEPRGWRRSSPASRICGEW
jgi:hypothetical protein